MPPQRVVRTVGSTFAGTRQSRSRSPRYCSALSRHMQCCCLMGAEHRAPNKRRSQGYPRNSQRGAPQPAIARPGENPMRSAILSSPCGIAPGDASGLPRRRSVHHWRVTLSVATGMVLLACTVNYNRPAPPAPYQEGQAATPPPASAAAPAPQPATPPASEWRPTNIAEAIAVCRRIHAADQIPVACSIEYYGGAAFILMAFADRTTAAAWIPALADYVGIPFCRSTNAANRQGFVMFSIAKEQLANLYACESDQLSGWFDIRQLLQQQSPPQHPHVEQPVAPPGSFNSL